jgi:hypothetical protein
MLVLIEHDFVKWYARLGFYVPKIIEMLPAKVCCIWLFGMSRLIDD